MLNDLPNGQKNRLDELMHIKQTTGLVDTDLSVIHEWYCTEFEDNFPKKVAITILKADTADLEDELFRQQLNLNETKKYLLFLLVLETAFAFIDYFILFSIQGL